MSKFVALPKEAFTYIHSLTLLLEFIYVTGSLIINSHVCTLDYK